MHVTHFWTLEGVGYADALFHFTIVEAIGVPNQDDITARIEIKQR